jgi:hypothetical protein
MARIRTIKPEIWTDEKFTECSVSARLLFIGLLNFADDNGNLVYSAKRFKMQILPADAIDCQPLIIDLITHGLLMDYSVSEINYLHIIGFTKHQVINRPSKTSIPLPPLTEDSLTEAEAEGNGKEQEVNNSNMVTEPVNDFQKVFDHGAALIRDLETKDTSPIRQWLNSDCSVDLDILPTISRIAKLGRAETWGYFTKPIADSKANREKPMPKGTAYEKPATNPQYRNQPTKTDRLKAAALRAAVAGGYANVQPSGEAGADNDGLSVFPIP